MGAAHKTEGPPYGYDHTEDFLSGRSEEGVSSLNWNLCQCELNLIKFICYCALSPCLLKTYSTIESLSIYIILKNPQRRGIRTLAYCV